MRDKMKRTVSMLVAMVLIIGNVLPATSLGAEVSCSTVEHSHTAECYIQDKKLICEEVPAEGHTHGSECYKEKTEQICPLEVSEAHIHDETCYTQVSKTGCGLEETDGHIHADDCYEEVTGQICTLEENEGHVHTDDCYHEVETLTCTNEEASHTHVTECYVKNRELNCGLEEGSGKHIHDQATCFKTEQVVICGIEEGAGAHKHNEACQVYEEVLSCDKEESEGHVHGDTCFETTQELVCVLEEKEGHTHTDTCYEVTEQLVCEKEEHNHAEECYAGLAETEKESEEETKAPREGEAVYLGKLIEKVTLENRLIGTDEWMMLAEKVTEKAESLSVNETDELRFTIEFKIPGGTLQGTASVEYVLPLKSNETVYQDKEEAVYAPDKVTVIGKAVTKKDGTMTITFEETYLEANDNGTEINGIYQFMANANELIYDAENKAEIKFLENKEIFPDELLNTSAVILGFEKEVPETETTVTETEETEVETTGTETEETEVETTGTETEETEVETTGTETEETEVETTGTETEETETETSVTEMEETEEAVVKNKVEFQVGEGAVVFVENVDANTTDRIAMAKDGIIYFTIQVEEGYELVEVIVDGTIPIMPDEVTGEYRIANIQTDDTIVTVTTITRLTSQSMIGEITVTCEEGTVEKGTQLDVKDDIPNLEDVNQAIDEKLAENFEESTNLRPFDIDLTDEKGKEAEISGEVTVNVTLAEPVSKEDAEEIGVEVYQVTDEGNAEEVTDITYNEEANGESTDITGFSFTTTNTAPYVFVEKETITVEYLTDAGETYEISMDITGTTNIPPSATLAVRELTDAQYAEYYAKVVEVLGEDAGEIVFTKLFDITIMDGENEIQPDGNVTVEIKLKDEEITEAENTQVVHFGETTEVLAAEVEENTVKFEANGFSVYAIVGTETITTTYLTADGETYTVTVTFGKDAEIPKDAELRVSEYTEESKEYKEYYKAVLETISDNSQTKELVFARFFDISLYVGDQKIEPKASVEVSIDYEESVNLEETLLTVIHFGDEKTEVLPAETVEDEKGISEVMFSTESFSTFATVSERINNSSVSESVIAYFNFDEIDNRGGFTSEVNGKIAYATPIVSGTTPVLLPAYDGSILEFNNSNNNALSVTMSDGSSLLSGLTGATVSYWAYTTDDRTSWAYYAAPNGDSQIYANENYIGVLHNGGNLNVERYYNGRNNGNYAVQGAASTGAWHHITVVYANDSTSVYVDGVLSQTKTGQVALGNILGNNSIFQIGKANWGAGEFFSGYLDEMMILNRALTADEVALVYGSGYSQDVQTEKQDKISISDLVNYTLNNGIDTVTDSNNTVPEGSYRTTYAGKVLKDVIFYTAVYDDKEDIYDYYAVSHSGSLVKISDLGSEIAWKDIRNVKWDLIVYTNTHEVDGITQIVPSGYYELAYTDSSGTHFLAPQIDADSVIQDGVIGLQFFGISDNTYGTTIEAWDANKQEQAGLQIVNGELTAVAGKTSEVFYFARNTEEVSYEQPREVATLDSASKGIQIKMFDYSGTGSWGRIQWMTDLMGDDVYRSGHQVTLDLVKRNLSNGVPVASLTGNSLAGLFSNNVKYENANHLFLEGTYNETGYYSYNSAQNYAYCDNGGNFIVYDRAAAPNGTGSANYHGNFFPYNTFGEASTSQLMLYDVNDSLLTPDDPKYREELYSLDNINYFFGMEIATDFYQTRTGLDAYGNDIIYEFNGDDDLWVFIDDKLALDIGGVHGAIHGTINFTTGEIIVDSDNKYSVTGESSPQGTTISGGIRTTLAEQFHKAYKEQGLSDEQITAILDDTFIKDENGNYTSFTAYTIHNMKMFYMERGAGASNLKIRFNMPVVPPASFVVEKKLPDTVQDEYTDKRFAFKVYVQESYGSQNYIQITQDQIGSGKLVTNVVYENTSTSVALEQGILYLKPEEAVQFMISDERLNYYVEEVMIDPDLWDKVEINGETTLLIDATDNNLKCVRSDYKPVNQRGRVVFDNKPKYVQKLLISKVVESDDPENVDKTLPYEFYVYLETQDGNLGAYSRGEYYLTKIIETNGVNEKHYFDNSYRDLGTQPQICTYSGQNGSIGNIRAGYTIEIPGLLPGTDFYVVERADRIPEGYMFVNKTLITGTYDETDNSQSDGKIKAGVDAEVVVTNTPINKLRVYKTWVDYDQVDTHGNVTVALYRKAGDTLVLVEDSLRTITPSMNPGYVEYTLPGADLSKYVVREVEVTGTGDQMVISPVSDGSMIEITGETTGSVVTDRYYYASYGTPENTSETMKDGFGNDVSIAVRKDTITNTLPYLKLKKTDVTGNALADAEFNLTDEDNNILYSLKSDVNGWLKYGNKDTLYLGEGNYYLTETKAPNGYNILTNRIKITVDKNGISNIVENSTTIYQDKDAEITQFEFDIPNTPGFRLPNTGGNGTLPYTLSGIALIIGSALMYGFWMRRRERRLN